MKRDRNMKELGGNMTIAQVWKAERAKKELAKSNNQEIKAKNKQAA